MSTAEARHRPARGTDAVFFAVMDAAASAVVLVGPDGTVDDANPAAAAMFGCPREELVGTPVDDLVGHEHAASHAGLRHRYAEEPAARPYRTHDRLLARRRDGSEFPVEASLTPIDTDEGLWTIVSLVDLTQRAAEDRRLRDVTRSLLMLSSLNQAILRARDADDLFREVCRVVVEEGGFSGAWVSRPLGADTMEVAATGGSMDAWAGRRIDLAAGLADGLPSATALALGTAVFHDDLQTAPVADHVRESAMEAGIRAVMVLPLRRGADVVAALTIYAEHAAAFDEGLRRLLHDVADNVAHALTSLDAVRRLDEVAAHRSELLGRLVDAQEVERARIAADVHDDPVQELAAMDLRLGLLRRRLEGEGSAAVDDVRRIQGMVTAVSRGLRELLFELEPGSELVDLATLVRGAAEHVFEGTSTCWSLELPPGGEVGPLPEQVRVQALRIVKEAMINVRKHADARQVRVSLARQESELRLEVADDGVGLGNALEGPAVPGHRGLASMRDRAEVLGGDLSVTDGAAGTVVQVRLPLAEHA